MLKPNTGQRKKYPPTKVSDWLYQEILANKIAEHRNTGYIKTANDAILNNIQIADLEA